jgi:hypothetical protein
VILRQKDQGLVKAQELLESYFKTALSSEHPSEDLFTKNPKNGERLAELYTLHVLCPLHAFQKAHDFIQALDNSSLVPFKDFLKTLEKHISRMEKEYMALSQAESSPPPTHALVIDSTSPSETPLPSTPLDKELVIVTSNAKTPFNGSTPSLLQRIQVWLSSRLPFLKNFPNSSSLLLLALLLTTSSSSLILWLLSRRRRALPTSPPPLAAKKK